MPLGLVAPLVAALYTNFTSDKVSDNSSHTTSNATTSTSKVEVGRSLSFPNHSLSFNSEIHGHSYGALGNVDADPFGASSATIGVSMIDDDSDTSPPHEGSSLVRFTWPHYGACNGDHHTKSQESGNEAPDTWRMLEGCMPPEGEDLQTAAFEDVLLEYQKRFQSDRKAMEQIILKEERLEVEQSSFKEALGRVVGDIKAKYMSFIGKIYQFIEVDGKSGKDGVLVPSCTQWDINERQNWFESVVKGVNTLLSVKDLRLKGVPHSDATITKIVELVVGWEGDRYFAHLQADCPRVLKTPECHGESQELCNMANPRTLSIFGEMVGLGHISLSTWAGTQADNLGFLGAEPPRFECLG